MTTVYFNGAACGAGKTQNALETIAKGCELSSKVLFASRTKELSAQSNNDFNVKLEEQNRSIDEVIITSNTVDVGMVTTSINKWLRSDKNGICFVTHKSLSLIDKALMQGVSVVCDEVPTTDLVENHLVMVSKSGFGSISGMVEQIPVEGKKYRHVKVKEGKEEKLREVLKGHQLGKQNALSNEFLNVLRALTGSNNTTVYSFHSEDRDQYCFGCLDVSQLVEVIKCSDSFTVLAANFKQSIIGYLLEEHLNSKITQSAIFKRDGLAQKHNKKVTVYPLLSSGRWSSSLKSRSAKTALGVNDSETVGEWAVKTSNQILKDEYLLYQNTSELKKGYDTEFKEVKRCSVIVHGLNKYSHYHKAAFLASLVPTPMEMHFYRVFCDDNSLNYDALEEVLYIERMYEVCYQCIARTSIRNFDDDNNNIFVVPDMRFVKYLKRHFEKDCFIVDDTYSKSIIAKDYDTSASIDRKRIKLKAMIKEASNGESVRSVCNRHKISTNTYYRWLKAFESIAA